MPKFNIQYAAKTKCEGVRIAVRLGGHEFTEKVITRDELEKQGGTGCIVKIDGKTFHQGVASLRLLGNITKVDGKALYSDDPLVGLEIDTAIENIKDFRNKILPMMQEKSEEKRPRAMGKLEKDLFPEHLKKLEETAGANGGPYLCGKYLSIADLELLGTLNWINSASDSAKLLDAYPRMKKLISTYKKHAALEKARASS